MKRLGANEAVIIIVFIVIITILLSVARITVEIPQSSSKLLISCIPIIDSASQGGFNGGVIEKLVNFHRVGQFLALRMVNFSSLHDD
jgi:hypothetical protein